MFELGPQLTGPGRMLFTGDGTGWDIHHHYQFTIPDLHAPLKPEDEARVRPATRQEPQFLLMKIPHHGSQRNNTIGADQQTFERGILDFFAAYNARTYLISSHPLVGPSNPDTASLPPDLGCIANHCIVCSSCNSDCSSSSESSTPGYILH
jgi:hypothetical protein